MPEQPPLPLLRTCVLVGLMALVGCASPPRAVPPEPPWPVPPQFHAQNRAEGLLSEPLAFGPWWKALGDQRLDDLVDSALAHNQDLRAGMARWEQARSMAARDQANLRPSVGLNPQVGIGQTSGNVDSGVTVSSPASGAAPLSVSTQAQTTRWKLPLEASYEPDLWGRLALAAQASSQRRQASKHDLELARHSLVASVVSTYHWLGVLGGQLDLLQHILRHDERRIRAQLARQAVGLADGNALAAMQMQGAQTQSRLQQVEEQIDLTRHLLALLCGLPLDRLPQLHTGQSDPGQALQRLPLLADLPASVLQRRPDVRGSQALLSAALSDVGVAQADFLPYIRLTGGTGRESSALPQLLTSGSQIWSLAAQINVPLFDGGRRDAQFQYAQARLTEASHRHQATVLQALREVEDALVSASTRRNQVTLQAQATAAADQIAAQALRQAQVGRLITLQAIDSQQAALHQRLSLLDAQGQALAAQVNLIKVLAYP